MINKEYVKKEILAHDILEKNGFECWGRIKDFKKVYITKGYRPEKSHSEYENYYYNCWQEAANDLLGYDTIVYAESLEYLQQYSIISEETENKIKRHCKRYSLKPDICAWYRDMQDFFSDWCELGYTKTEARKLLHSGSGEFQIINDFGIVRYVL